MKEPTDDLITQRESDLRWSAHMRAHEQIDSALQIAATASSKALGAALVDHHREHEVHDAAHAREHQYAKDALDKADNALDKRLEGMNEFRAQLATQSSTFVTRDMFDAFVKESTVRTQTALENTTEKNEAIVKAVINRHDADFNSLRDALQIEREIRKGFESSVSTWKWIASFLGVGGIGGVIALFLTRGG